MTYIESAFSDFTRHVLTSGIRTLFTKKYLAFTLSGLIIVGMNSFVIILGADSSYATPENIKLFLSLEVAISLSFFFAGLLLGRLNLLVQVLAIASLSALFTVLFYQGIIVQNYLQYLTAFLFLFWIVVGTVSQFSFFRDFLGNPVFGGILFLGKHKDDGKVLFGGVVFLITLLNIVLGVMLFNLGLTDNSLVNLILGAIIVIAGIVNIIPTLGIQRKGDVFFTTLTWFYVIGTVRGLYLVFQLMSGGASNPQGGLLDLIMTLFMIIFAVHKAASTTKDYMNDVDGSEDEDDKKKPNRVVEFFSPNGIFLMILGSAIGYHATTMEFRLQSNNILADFSIQKELPWSLISHEVTVVTYVIIYMIFIVLFFFSPRYRRFANPEIMRIEWLPPYEDMKLLIVSIVRGEVDYKLDALKLGANIIKDKLGGMFGRKSDKGVEGHLKNALGNLLDKSKKGKD